MAIGKETAREQVEESQKRGEDDKKKVNDMTGTVPKILMWI